MKLEQIEIDQYGTWDQLRLPLNANGISVIYGPNEAGKSTLMQFVRQMLYAESSGDWQAHEKEFRQFEGTGHLTLDHDGESYRLTRQFGRQGVIENGTVIEGPSGEVTSERFHREILKSTSAALYERVFAVSLSELQHLGTLENNEVSQFVYGRSLGDSGEKLLHAGRALKEKRRRIFDPEQNTGLLKLHTDSRDDLISTPASKRFGAGTTSDVKRKITQKQAELDQLEERRSQLTQQLAYTRLLADAWKPWRRERDLLLKMEELPRFNDFPEDGIVKLDRLDQKLRETTAQLKQLLPEYKALDQQQRQVRQQPVSIPTHLREQSRIEALLEQRDLIEDSQQKLSELSSDAQMLRADFERKLGDLGEGWTEQRLLNLDLSPNASLRMMRSAKAFQSARSRKHRFKKRYQSLSDKVHQQQTTLQEQLRKDGINSLEQAREKVSEHLRELEDLAILRIQQTETHEKIRGIDNRLKWMEEGYELPWWATFMLSFFGLAGGFFLIAGLFRSVTDGWLIGAIYLMTGLMCGGLAWAMQTHYKSDSIGSASDLQRERERLANERNTLNARIETTLQRSQELLGIRPTEVQNTSTDEDLFPELEMLQKATNHLMQLEQLARTEQSVQRKRRSLSVRRGKLPALEKLVNSTRQNWCQLLKEIGLEETVQVSEAFSMWETAHEALLRHEKWQDANDQKRQYQERLNLFRQQANSLSNRLGWQENPDQPLLGLLDRYQSQLQEIPEVQVEVETIDYERYDELKRQIRTLKKQYATYLKKRRALLSRGGAKTRAEFLRHSTRQNERDSIREQMALAREEMLELSTSNPELALVEEDLLRFDAEENRLQVETFEAELLDIAEDISQTSQQIGQLQQQEQNLSEDTTEDDYRFDLAQAEDRLEATQKELVALSISEALIEKAQHDLEQRKQPETLKRASEWFYKMSLGRYVKVSSESDRHQLVIEDRHGATWSVDQLSRGTREQLFLAIRFSIIESHSQQGIHLPVVLDDVIVNFDQPRSEAAVEAMIEFANQGHQLLMFTCHLHLTHLFEARGVDPIWLPSPEATRDPRYAV